MSDDKLIHYAFRPKVDARMQRERQRQPVRRDLRLHLACFVVAVIKAHPGFSSFSVGYSDVVLLRWHNSTMLSSTRYTLLNQTVTFQNRVLDHYYWRNRYCCNDPRTPPMSRYPSDRGKEQMALSRHANPLSQKPQTLRSGRPIASTSKFSW